MEPAFGEALLDLIDRYEEEGTPLMEIASALELAGYALDERMEDGE